MSTLTDFLTNIANAIRTKKGTTDTILASDFATEITNLPSGGSELAGIIDGTATSVTIPSGATNIRDYAFYNYSNLASIVIPNGVTSIGIYAFNSCSNLTSVTIPNGITSISTDLFSYCINLTSVSIPNSVTNIGVEGFRYCINLTSITIPNSVTNISSNAFRDCTGLISITIPNSVVNIGLVAFLGCSSLLNVTLETGFNCNNLDLSSSTLFTSDTLVNMLTALADRTSLTAYTLTLGSTNLAKLTDAQKAIATQKNWTLA